MIPFMPTLRPDIFHRSHRTGSECWQLRHTSEIDQASSPGADAASRETQSATPIRQSANARPNDNRNLSQFKRELAGRRAAVGYAEVAIASTSAAGKPFSRAC